MYRESIFGIVWKRKNKKASFPFSYEENSPLIYDFFDLFYDLKIGLAVRERI
jgi:hypothetical protein